MPIKLTNTLGGKKEEFVPIKPGQVGMYHCGPTVYDYIHIGNLRAFVTADIIRRVFELNGYTVTQIINITDVGILSGDNADGEDKMTKGLIREGKPITLEAMKELGDFYTERFKEEAAALNIETPTAYPKASEHIAEDIELIKTLESKGFAYTTSDGVYFDISKDPQYGKLGGINKNESETIARVAANSEKKDQRDFALWKFNPGMGFESPWGKGFPGWHIECSAMSKKYLGETFEIHTGGIDLASIHHNNEIAQSENACGCQFVKYWLHNAFVNVDSGKMAKSEGTGIRLQTIIDKGFPALAYRYWLLGAHYRTPMIFSWEALEGASNAYDNLIDHMLSLGEKTGSVNEAYLSKFKGFVNDDFDTAKGLALTWEMLKDASLSNEDKRTTALAFDAVLGLGLDSISFSGVEVPEEIRKLADEREETRRNKDFAKADELRKAIEARGFEIKDTAAGPSIKKAK